MKNKLINFFNEELWQANSPDTSPSSFKTYSLHYLKIFTLSVKGFIKDHGTLRASALTLYTLLSIVPIIAMLFGVAKGFGFEKTLEQQILEQVPDQDTLILQLIDMAKTMLESTKGGLVAGFGIVILFWTVIKVIGNIEESFNHIWQVKKARPISRKLSDYLSLMLFAPVMLIAANSINVIVQIKLSELINAIALPGTIAALQLLAYLPIIILWGLFSFLFMFMPNTKVNYQAGLFAGIISGTIYFIVQSLYVSLQIGVSSYNAIYGSFAALPLFLIWLQITWVIVLLGSELSFYYQNIELYQFNQKFKHLNFKSKKQLALHIMHTLIEDFSQPNTNFNSARTLSLKLKIPIPVIKIILHDLSECQLLSVITDKNTEETGYQPARDIRLLSDKVMTDALENLGTNYTIQII